MEEFTQEIEALKVLEEYNDKLLKGIDTVVKEINGEKLPDTSEYLNKIIEGVNWEIQIINGTLEFINKDEEKINKEELNNIINNFSEKYMSDDDMIIAKLLSGEIKEMLELFGKVAAEY